MPDFRAFARPPVADPTVIELDPDETHHLVRVNRARAGDTVVVFDGQGREWVGACGEVVRDRVSIQVRFRQNVAPLPYSMVLAQALPKGRHLADIIRRATELGVARIVPLLSARVVVQIDEDREDRKLEQWRTAALEACKQSGNSHLPVVEPARPVADFLASPGPADLRLIASLQPGAERLRDVLARRRSEGRPPPREVVWMIGPEGDFTPAEIGAARVAGFTPVTLGPLVLRCETAAIHALSILGYELQAPS